MELVSCCNHAFFYFISVGRIRININARFFLATLRSYAPFVVFGGILEVSRALAAVRAIPGSINRVFHCRVGGRPSDESLAAVIFTRQGFVVVNRLDLGSFQLFGV